MLTTAFLLQKQHTLNICQGNAKMLTKPSIVPHFVILNKKMYKSAYMVQIMRSKRSIKDEGKEK